VPDVELDLALLDFDLKRGPGFAKHGDQHIKRYKHGDHDQSTHGNWSTGDGDDSSSYRESWAPVMSPEEGHAWAEAAGTKLEETVVHMTSKSAADGIVGTGFDIKDRVAGVLHETGAYFATDMDAAKYYDFKGIQAVSAVVVVTNPVNLNLTDPEHSIAVSDVLVDNAVQAMMDVQTLGVTEIEGTMFDSFAEGYSDADAFRARALEAAGILEDNPRAIKSGLDTTIALKNAGFDGVIIKGLSPEGNVDGTNQRHAGAVGGNQVIVFDKEQAVVIGVTPTVTPEEGANPEALFDAFAKHLFSYFGFKHGDHDQQSHAGDDAGSSDVSMSDEAFFDFAGHLDTLMEAEYADQGDAWWDGTCDTVVSTLAGTGLLEQPFKEVMYGSFRDDEGNANGHCWVELADGSILDPTIGQFFGAEGDYPTEFQKLVRPGDELFDRYTKTSTTVVTDRN